MRTLIIVGWITPEEDGGPERIGRMLRILRPYGPETLILTPCPIHKEANALSEILAKELKCGQMQDSRLYEDLLAPMDIVRAMTMVDEFSARPTVVILTQSASLIKYAAHALGGCKRTPENFGRGYGISIDLEKKVTYCFP